VAEAIGLNPLMSGARVEDEGHLLVQHQYWLDAMRRALAVEKNFKEQAHVDHV
jgi:benzoate/toluate 1,2-dioxygenase subunit alpha